MVDKERVISIMRMKGPILPNAIAKEIGLDILMSGAVLAEMSDNKKVKISSLKVGGSPLYYLPGQESQLMRFADRLNEKEQRAYHLLKEQKVLRDNAVTPLERVALRAIKDFAVPLKVKSANQEELFWKFFLVNNEEATTIIKQILQVEERPPAAATPVSTPARAEPAPVQQQVRVPAPQVASAPVTPSMPVKAREEQPQQRRPEQQTLPVSEEILAKIRGDAFLEKIYSFFRFQGIRLLELEVKRKNSDADMIVAMPSPVGMLHYTCKAKSKKKITDGDLSSAYVTASSRKLPLLFITTGELTKRAQEMLGKEFRGMAVKRI